MTQACHRTGQCCQVLWIPLSPKVLREAYQNWKENKPGAHHWDEIYLIYPMLEGTCKGKNENGWFVYGPCKHFIKSDEKQLPSCSIHSNKPRMCSGYPFYQVPQAIQMSGAGPLSNPASFKGCGFNMDPNHGKTVQEALMNLLPLTEDEK